MKISYEPKSIRTGSIRFAKTTQIKSKEYEQIRNSNKPKTPKQTQNSETKNRGVSV